jgi:ParB family transcriptional regulator, chromosome partitioning protein
MSKVKGLGRGLDALLAPDEPQVQDRLAELPVANLRPGRYQPRTQMNPDAIADLADSIKAQGVIQPILVRPVQDGHYEIIAGERRWRAAKLAGLESVPVLVRDVRDELALAMALIENIQREDLNPIEEATAFKRLVDEFDLTQEEIAAAVGKDRSTVANLLRLLKLPEEVKTEVSAGRLAMGHARALLALEQEQDQRNLAREVVTRGLSVRETEQLVTHTLTKRTAGDGGGVGRGVAPRLDVHTRDAQDRLRLKFGTRVDIVRRGKGGEIRVGFKNEDELIRIFEILSA